MIAMAKAYAASRIKRCRASAAEMEERRNAIRTIVAEIQPATVRQVFYQCVVRGLVEKNEAAYEKVQRAIVALRRDREMPYGWIVDGTRWMRKPTTFNTLAEAVNHTAATYRKALWADLPVYVEVWIEKDALAGAVYPVTSEFDVPLMVARGFASLSFLASAAEYMDGLDKQVFVYQLGDHDPSGVAAAASIERDLRALAPSADITFKRLAVTPDQIEAMALPLRPTKRSDLRAAKFEAEFGAGSVELDAIHPESLRAIVRGAIERHVDRRELEVLMVAERSERQVLRMFAARVAGEDLAKPLGQFEAAAAPSAPDSVFAAAPTAIPCTVTVTVAKAEAVRAVAHRARAILAGQRAMRHADLDQYLLPAVSASLSFSAIRPVRTAICRARNGSLTAKTVSGALRHQLGGQMPSTVV